MKILNSKHVGAIKNSEWRTDDLFERNYFDSKKSNGSFTIPTKDILNKFSKINHPSHHQKMVLVDHESPADHLGFVMGHNMLDAYWDKDSHSITQRQKHAPWLGPNGELPRQDLSSRVSGPICDNLLRNFSMAWKTAGGKPLPDISMANYPLRQQFGPSFQCQIVRTYPTNIKDIQHIYLKAVNNASQCIYIENQYFRWPPLADKIKQAAAKQCQWGRDPAQHSSLYLFVVTNSSDDGLGSGSVGYRGRHAGRQRASCRFLSGKRINRR